MPAVTPGYVSNACALLRQPRANPGSDVVRDLLYAARREEAELVMYQIGLGEVIYCIGKANGRATAERKRGEIASLPIRIVPCDDGSLGRRLN